MNSAYVPCKFCAELILNDAEICPHCIRELRTRPSLLHVLLTVVVFVTVIVGCMVIALPAKHHHHVRRWAYRLAE